jgi:uncharacterized protein YegL
MAIDFGKVKFDESNPDPRCACVLLLDTSGSMGGSPIDELNIGLQEFKKELCDDGLAKKRVEVAIITFGGSVNVACDFTTAEQFAPPILHASGGTPMGSALNLALDKIEERKAVYKKNGVYYRPWIFLVTDGLPDDVADFDKAAERAHEYSRKKVAIFAVGVEGADMAILSKVSTREPVNLKGLKFKEMFVWLSASLSAVSQSQPGDDVPLQTPATWGKV